MKTFTDCKFSAFISYAHADDAAWFSWVTYFANELDTGLRALLRGVDVKPLHLSGSNGPVSGVLSEELKQRIEESFAMIIVVHDNYAHSDWCLKELEYFKSLFGDDGFRQRLYIVALSHEWMTYVERKPDWQRLCPFPDQLWIPFYQDRDQEKPVDIYAYKGVVSSEFKEPFVKLRQSLVNKVKEDVDGRNNGSAKRSPAVLVKGVGMQQGQAAPQKSVSRIVFGATTSDIRGAVSDICQTLGQQSGLSAQMLDGNALLTNFPEFESADALVLGFNDSQLLLSKLDGGHLALQRDAWLASGKTTDTLLWLDMRHIRSSAPATGDSLNFIKACGAFALTPAALVARLTEVRSPGDQGVHIYIESNQNERGLWEPLGEQIKTKWDEIVKRMQVVPPLYVRPRGLPVDQIDQYPRLDDADGVVLLWGRKTPDALVAQINKIEGKLSGRDVAPGIVAYLMPPHEQTEAPMPAWGWKVLRFDAKLERQIDVVKEEADDLQNFLEKILARSTHRRAANGSPAAAAAN